MDSKESITSQKNAIAKVLEMAQNRALPTVGSVSPLQKALIRKIRQQIKETNPRMDFLKVEVTARKMASWIEGVSKEATTRQLGSVQARKVVVSGPEIEAGTLISEQDNGEQLFVREVSPDIDISKLSLGKTGKKARLKDNRGNIMLVEGLKSPDGEKTLVTKESINGDLSMWLLFTANSFKDVHKQNKPEIKLFKENLKTFVKKTRQEMSEEEWNNFIRDKLMKSVNWREDLKQIDPNNINIDQVIDLLKHILESHSPEQFSTKGQ